MNLADKFRDDKTFRNNSLFTIGLLLVLVYGSIIFGARVYLVALVAIVAAVAVEYLFFKTRKIPIGSSVLITPLLLTLLLPPTIPLWMAVVGSLFGTFFGKMLFGGEGKYIFNPAVVGILFMLISFPAQMNTMWLHPQTGEILTYTPVNSVAFYPFPTATFTMNDLIFGLTPGAIGETVRLFIALVGIALIALKVIDWKPVVSFLVSFVLLTLLFNLFSGPRDVLFSLMTGTVIFASVFLVSDPVSAPKYAWARVLYGAGIALVTIVIRVYAAFPEGIIFAIIIMNAVSPLLDSIFEKEVTA